MIEERTWWLPSRLLGLADYNPESVRKVSSPTAPARLNLAVDSHQLINKPTTPRAVLAASLRSRACSTHRCLKLTRSLWWTPRSWGRPVPGEEPTC